MPEGAPYPSALLGFRCRRDDAARLDCRQETVPILLSLVAVSNGKVAYRLIKVGAAAKISGHQGRIADASMRARESVAAQQA